MSAASRDAPSRSNARTLRRWGGAWGLLAACSSLVLGILVTTGAAASGAPRPGSPLATGDPDPDALAYEVSQMTAVYLDPKTGAVLAKRRYGAETQGRTIRPPAKVLDDHGSGGTGSASGRVRVTITQWGYSSLGVKLWTWKVWTDWSWDRSAETVTMNDKGTIWDINDNSWEWDGVANAQNYYYDLGPNDGHPKSAYWHAAQGSFSGWHLGSIQYHEYPRNTLSSHYNGTNEWWTSCC
jgi:hypothetical protein